MSIRKILFEIFIIASTCLLALSQSQNLPTIKKIEIYGNKHLSKHEIVSPISDIVKLDTTLIDKIEKIKETILNLYIYNGFYFADIDSIKTENQVLKVFITEGERARTGKIEITGNKALSDDDINELLGLREGEFFSTQILSDGINKILNRYANIGYPLAKIKIADLSFEENGLINFTLDINEGKLIKIEQIKIYGNDLTKEKLILRETRIRRGEVYREEKLKQVRKRLLKLGLFETVQEPEIFFNDTISGVLIKVKEGRMNLFDGIIGYIPKTSSKRGYFTGYINILLKNLFGTGRKFNTRWSAETPETQEFEISYLEPYVANLPINAEISFYQRKQDSSYVIRKPKINFEIELTGWEKVSDFFKASIYLSQISIIPTTTEFIVEQIFESKTLNAGVGVIYDSRDDIIFPKSGIYFSSFYEVGNKKILGPARLLTPEIRTRSTVNKFRFTLDFYFNFEKILKSIFVLGSNAVIIAGQGIDESDVFRFGGTKTLRGYREREFLATQAIWTNLENRFKLSEDFIVFNFVDAGYIYHPSLLPRIKHPFEAVRFGYGIGIKLNTKIGMLNLIYALGKGDSFKTGKIHIGIESEF